MNRSELLRMPWRRWVTTLGVVGLLAPALAGCGTVDRDDLSSYLDQLHSDAAEGVLLCGQAAKGSVPVSFTWIQSAELEHHVEELLSHLDKEMPAQGLVSAISRAKYVASELQLDFEELHANANSRTTAAAVRFSLSRHGQAAESLFESLQ